MTKKIAVLGSTGVIGTKALSVIEAAPENFAVHSICAHCNAELALEQARKFRPKTVCFTGLKYDRRLKDEMPRGTEAYFGPDSFKYAVDGCDAALLAFVGMAGLPALMHCVSEGVSVALANKEALVCGGELIRKKLNETGRNIIPVDSELSAVFQALGSKFDTGSVRRVILTASGGPFRTWDYDRIYAATAAQALRHPNWSMGRKITVDCATMMNKGLEVMETRWLFDVDPGLIDIVVHPQSVVHSMVEYIDGAVMAHMSPTDMSHAIQYALSWPERMPSPVGYMDFSRTGPLTFEPPDFKRFPCMKLAIDCLKHSQAACVVLNAANEAAVSLLLENRITVGRIYELVREALDAVELTKCENIENVFELSAKAENFVYNVVE